MSLNWDLSDIKNQKELCWMKDGLGSNGQQQFRMHPATETLIFMTLAVEIGEITKKNWEEWFLRARVWEKAMGALRHDGKKDHPITPEEVKLHIGLKTNVFPKASAAAFAKKLVQALERDERSVLFNYKSKREQACVVQQSTAATE
jgi:hypothetical protein